MMLYENYYRESVKADGSLAVDITYPDDFNFGWDVVARTAEDAPGKRALVWCNAQGDERIFSFDDINRESSRLANLLLAEGIKRGDRVILVLKRHYLYWTAAVALHKIGAVMIPMTHMLTADDFAFRFSASGAGALIAVSDEELMENIRKGELISGRKLLKWAAGKASDGFRDIIQEMSAMPDSLARMETKASDPMAIYFTSGTTGSPKGVIHDFTYPLAHIVTAKLWQGTKDGGLHFTVAETGWAKASWGKIYGQWLTGSAVMAYDFDSFDPAALAAVINRYGVTSFCAPPTVYRYLARKGIPAMPSLERASTAGEYLSPEIFRLFREKTGLDLQEGYGQTETVLLAAPFGRNAEAGSMGRPSPLFDIRILKDDGTEAAEGEPGEIVIVPDENRKPIGIFTAYLDDEKLYEHVWEGGVYHTGDEAWKDGNGCLWFNGRKDEIIKSGGFRIGPGEIEDVLITHPAVLECSVTGVPDELRGQAIKATVVLSPGLKPGERTAREIREYCNRRLAEYKWIRTVEFRESMPRTISGKIRKSLL